MLYGHDISSPMVFKSCSWACLNDHENLFQVFPKKNLKVLELFERRRGDLYTAANRNFVRFGHK